jgi:hypothetical protein
MAGKALVLENQRGIMERKRKMQRTGAQGSHKRFCGGFSSQGPIFHPGQQIRLPIMQAGDQGFQTPRQQIHSTILQSHRSALSPP